jgi:beta-lactamase class A
MKTPSILGAILAPAALLALVAAAPPPAHVDTTLERRLEALAANAPGHCAIAAHNLRTGAVARVNGDARAHLMSVCKVPIAVVVLDGVDHGRWSLNTRVPLRRSDMNPGASVLTEKHPEGGVAVPVHELLDLMLTVSDNTATDALLKMAGGPARVTAWLEGHGIRGIRVDRSELQAGNEWYGLANLPPESTWSAARLRELRRNVPTEVRDRAARAFDRDPRDTATPEAIVDLLERVWRRELLSPAMTSTLEEMLARCATAPERLPALLPRGTHVARKTGTAGSRHGITSAVNDVGVMRLPNGDEVAIAVLVTDVRGPVSGAEAVIARSAREVFDAWNAKP